LHKEAIRLFENAADEAGIVYTILYYW